MNANLSLSGLKIAIALELHVISSDSDDAREISPFRSPAFLMLTNESAEVSYFSSEDTPTR